ncbi:hypothetical protein OOZ63_17245, partial [Paucibacter sp. PLA-PC-4]|uniref:hypothetical protein n=1 Tax=Paucibacter sp. PLA-PC-4 TaxID=2993655 RepID=UPI00224B34B1
MMQQPLSASLIRKASFAALFAACVAIAAYSSGGGSSDAGAGPVAATLQSTPNTSATSVAKSAATTATATTTARVLIPVVTAPATALSDGGPTLLTLRAHADVAGGVGAMVSLRVDGVVTDSVEVRATQPTDYALAA